MPEPHSNISSLLRLIDDPDEEVYLAVVAQIRAMGPSAIPELRAEIVRCEGPSARQRLTQIIRDFQVEPLNDLIRLLKLHQQSETDIDLEEALFLLDAFGRPEADRREVAAYLDDLALQVHEIFISQLPANDLTHVLSIHSVMFEREGFHGASADYYDPLNSYISSVIGRKEGIPVSLAAVELLIADRVGLEMTGVAMPYHFVLYAPELHLYIDPFHAGNFISRNDCITFLERSGLSFHEQMLQPVSNVDMIIRMIRNLSFAHNRKLEVWEAQVLEGALRDVSPSLPT